MNTKGLPLGRRVFRQKMHLVKWATVCSDRKAGGLGVRGLDNLIRALLSKWL